MENNSFLKALRPAIALELNGEKNPVELLMHRSLRPILKFNHGRLVQLVTSTQHYHHLTFDLTSLEGSREILGTFIQKNSALKNQLIGLVLGYLTEPEFEVYQSHKSALHKRIIEMCITRVLSTLEIKEVS